MIFLCEQAPEHNRLIYFSTWLDKNDEPRTDTSSMTLALYLGGGQIVTPYLQTDSLYNKPGMYWCYANVKIDKPATFKEHRTVAV